MAGTIKMFCIRMNILSHRSNIELFLPCNMAAMQNLYTNLKDYVYLKTFSLNSSSFLDAVRLGGGHWGLRYCGVGQFFLRYFGNFNLELRYCGILQTCGMRFLVILDGIKNSPSSPPTFSEPFPVSDRFISC